MSNLIKIAEIRGNHAEDVIEVVKALENQGFQVVDEDEQSFDYKRYHVLREYKNR